MNGDRAVILRLYKSLSKLAKRFDNAPSAKALIYRHSNEFNVKSQSARFYSDLLDTVLSNKQMLNPADGVVLYEVIKDQFKKINSDETLKLTHKIDAAFAANRKLTSLWKCYLSSISELSGVSPTSNYHEEVYKTDLSSNLSSFDHDMKSIDNARCINHLPTFKLWHGDVASGVVLVAHPLLQGQLGRSLVVMLEHGSEGSYGVVINKPNSQDLVSSVHNLPSNLKNAFSACGVSYGGPVRRLQYLHRNVDCAGALPIPFCEHPLVAGGSTDDSIQSLINQTSSKRDYSFYAGCCTWAPKQLQDELRRGLWIPVQTQTDLVVSLANYTVSSTEKDRGRIASFFLGTVNASKENFASTSPTTRHEYSDEDFDYFDEDEEEEGDEDELSSDDGLEAIDKTEENWEKVKQSAFADASTSTSSPTTTSVETNSVLTEDAVYSEFPHHTDTGDMQIAAQQLTNLRRPLLKAQSGDVHRVDVYQFALRSLGPVFQGLSALSENISASTVESSDWK